MLCGEVSSFQFQVPGFWSSHESGSILRKMAWLDLQTESISDKRDGSIFALGIYPRVKPKGNLRNKICAPKLPVTILTGLHPNADFNSPHSPVWRRWALRCGEMNWFQSVKETTVMM